MVFAELTCGIALSLQSGGESRCPSRDPDVCSCLADRRKASADRQLAGYEVRPARRAACLGVIVREYHAFRSQLVEVWRLPGHDAAMVRADIETANIVAHYDEYVRRPLL